MKKQIFILLTLILACSCVKKGEDAIYILPKDYTGVVIILYSQKNGVKKKYEENKRVYQIPVNGILKTQFDVDYGRTELPKFYYTKIDEKKQIPLVLDWKDYSSDKINVTLMSTGKSYQNVDGTSPIEFSTFFVGTKSQIEQASRKLEKLHIADLIDK